MTPNINKILALPANKATSKYGAQIGRASQTQGWPEKLYLQLVRLVDGGYDTGGAYWGWTNQARLWCAFSPEDSVNDPPIQVFVRALDRNHAMMKVIELLEEHTQPNDGWSFFPGRQPRLKVPPTLGRPMTERPARRILRLPLDLT